MATAPERSERAGMTSRHVAGLDLLRLVAVALVTMQHALTITYNAPWTMMGPINVGQLGVSLFLGVSGYLSMTSSKAAVPWLVERGRRLYPAYFVVIVASFILTWVTGYKPFSVGQVVSQILMLGLFTHPTSLINVPTWFMSLLLVGYLTIFLVRLFLAPQRADLGYCCSRGRRERDTGQRWPWYHLSTFFLAAGLATLSSRRSLITLLVAGLFLTLAWQSTCSSTRASRWPRSR